MSSPSFLLNDEHNYLLGTYLLEAFNNIIHHQYESNPNFVYSAVLHHDYFEKLNQLTFDSALVEVEKLRALREKKEEMKNEPKEKVEEEQAANSTKRGEEEEEQQIAEGSLTASDNSSSKFVSKSGFTPTEEWFSSWKPKLPLEEIIKLLEFLVPKIEEKCKDSDIALDEIKTYLATVSTKDVLTKECPIFIRKFQWGEALFIWFRSMLWGQNYVGTMKDYGPWNGTAVKLFQIKQG